MALVADYGSDASSDHTSQDGPTDSIPTALDVATESKAGDRPGQRIAAYSIVFEWPLAFVL